MKTCRLPFVTDCTNFSLFTVPWIVARVYWHIALIIKFAHCKDFTSVLCRFLYEVLTFVQVIISLTQWARIWWSGWVFIFSYDICLKLLSFHWIFSFVNIPTWSFLWKQWIIHKSCFFVADKMNELPRLCFFPSNTKQSSFAHRLHSPIWWGNCEWLWMRKMISFL